jgi:hypothetical protein
MRSKVTMSLALMVLGVTSVSSANMLTAERFTFARPPAPESTVDPKDRMSVDIDRWSTEADRERLRATVAESGEEKLLDAFRGVSRVGTLRWPGGLEYAVLYARSNSRPDGGTDVVLVVDRPLWRWWESKDAATMYGYTVVQLRLDKDGKGEGRLSLDVPVTRDDTFGVTLADYSKAPVVLVDVRREKQTT